MLYVLNYTDFILSAPETNLVDENAASGAVEVCVTLTTIPANTVTGNDIAVMFSTRQDSGMHTFTCHKK